jgi:formylglycine-generating enzyme required for sulfatase activity
MNPYAPHVPLHPLRPHGAAVTDVVFWLHAEAEHAHGPELALDQRRGAPPRLRLDLSGDGFALADLPLDLDTPVSASGHDVTPRTAARDLSAPCDRIKLHTVGAALQQRIVDALASACAAFPDECTLARQKLDRYFAAASERFPRRLVVVAEAAAMADDTPWEALRWRSAAGSATDKSVNPAIVNCSVQLVRCAPTTQAHFGSVIDGPLRVLLLVGSLDQGEQQGNCEGEPGKVAQALRDAARALQPLVDVRVVVTQGQLGELTTDMPIASLAEVDQLLRAEPGWHVVHLFCHGNLVDDAGTGEAVFTLRLPAPDDGEHPGAISGADPDARAQSPLCDQSFTTRDLRRALEGTPARVLILSACMSGGPVASALLACADHVVAMAGKVDPDWIAPVASKFYAALAQSQPMGAAVNVARAAITNRFAPRATLQHWARTLDVRPLVEPLRLREKHYRRFCELTHRSLFGPMMDDLVPDRADLLGDLFVELQLDDARLDARAEQTRVAALQHAHGLGLPRDPRHDADADLDLRAPLHQIILREHRRFVVLADPGAGKTTTLRQLARRFTHDQERLPVYLHLSRWRPREGRMPTLDEMLEALRPGLAEVFWAADQRKRVLLLLDGIDEYGDVARLKELLEWLHVEVQSTIVLTSRWVGYRAAAVPPEFWRLRILSLNDAKLDEREIKRQLLRRWFAARGAEQPETRAEATLNKLTGHLRQFTDTPLLLHLVAWLDEKGKPLSTMRHEVYRTVIDAVVAGEHRGPREGATPLPEVARDVLRALAWHLARTGKTHVGRDELCRAVQGDGHHRAPALREQVAKWHTDPRQVLEALGRETGLVRPREGFTTTDAEWGFWIKPFQDALVGEYLFEEVYEPARKALASAPPAKARGKQDPVDPAVAAQAQVVAFLQSQQAGAAATREESYGEAAALLTGWMPPSAREAWVNILLSDEALGLQRAGVRALSYLDEVAAKLLAGAMKRLGDGDERARFYARLVELAADRATAARLLGACAQACSAAAHRDLYEIDTLLLSVRDAARSESDGSGSDEARDQHAKLLQKFGSEDVGPKVRSAFAKLPDGADPWCDIPAGWFQRGSKAGEGYDNERPAMPVHISKAFVIGAATITQEQYALFDPSYKARWPGEHLPATVVTWYAATLFARWLGHHLGMEGALPTEAQWEYACRGVRRDDAAAVEQTRWPPFSCGDSLPQDVGWHREDTPPQRHAPHTSASRTSSVYAKRTATCGSGVRTGAHRMLPGKTARRRIRSAP